MPEHTSIHDGGIPLDALYRDTGFECQADFKESILKTAAWLKDEQAKTPPRKKFGFLNNSCILPFPASSERAVAA